MTLSDKMNSDLVDMVNEVKEKVILHWNYRGLTEIPEAVRDVGSHVQEIYLKWNELKSLPCWVSDFSNVTNLYLYGNNIEHLPISLGYMDKLTVLDLSANKLKELPSCIGYLKSLQSLLLNQNFITALPSSMSELDNLSCLCLSGNQMVALPEWLGSLPNLEELFVDNNLLEEIPNRLTLSTSLSMISVCSNRLSYLPPNGFLSAPCIRFDSNPYLNYLSLPLLRQLLSKVQHPLSQESGNAIAYGCFRSKSKKSDRLINIKLLLVSENNHGEHKQIVIELPRQLLTVHSLHENKAISLWEMSLRKVYLSRFYHTLNINFDSPCVDVKRSSVLEKSEFDMNECPRSFIPYNLMLNGPISICVNNFCNEPIFTEAWVLFGVERNAFGIPTIVILCSHRCTADFVKSSNFTESHEMYAIHR
ncbi:hypothetical protein TSAR_016035 [Trichomalopsis sarcophagae]|uniref:Disease resistance R13L4/SHOC-2-like LRR domain-containing protein n=1 Tax=Trichomalopsis sarcophagae TaxID=543379 RepID=A0A232EZA4_9HYME|nr:hypothetical protein TSAR_016035 [Trichomalopsis sarcophagae]